MVSNKEADLPFIERSVCVRMRAQVESKKAVHKTAATQGEQDKGFGSYGAMRMNP